MNRKRRTEFAILGMLTHGPKSGYDLKLQFEERISYFWAESLGQIYPTLRRLEAEELVKSKERPVSKGPRRIEYRITKKGRTHLANWLRDPVHPESVRNELMLKMYFGPQVDIECMIGHVEAFEAIQRQIQVLFSHYSGQIESEEVSDAQKVFWRLTLRSGQLLNEARLKWCREARKQLGEQLHDE